MTYEDTIPANFPDSQALSSFGAYAVGVLDGFLKDGADTEAVVAALFTGARLTGIDLPLDGD